MQKKGLQNLIVDYFRHFTRFLFGLSNEFNDQMILVFDLFINDFVDSLRRISEDKFEMHICYINILQVHQLVHP